MPQMAPYNWLMLNIFFLMIYLLYLIYIHFFMNLSYKMKFNYKIKKFLIKW